MFEVSSATFEASSATFEAPSATFEASSATFGASSVTFEASSVTLDECYPDAHPPWQAAKAVGAVPTADNGEDVAAPPRPAAHTTSDMPLYNPPMPPETPDNLIYHSEKLTYGSYLKIPQLLSLQKPLAGPAAHDETLFIISHQVYELWFRQMLHEVMEICRRLTPPSDDQLDTQALRAAHLFDRIHKIQALLIEQLPVLETMFSVDFATFRDQLAPASGFQSVQFRQLEFLCGAKNPKMLKLVGEDDAARQEMAKFLDAPTVYDHFMRHLSRAGFEIPEAVLNRDTSQPHEANEQVLDAMEKLYRDSDRYYPQFRVAEHFLEFEERFQIWRFGHVKMVERMIGGGMGTGGSAGAKYLAGTLQIRLFPEVWMVRDRLAGK